MSMKLRQLAGSVLLMAPVAAIATNGMNLEGYGPEALGMGGASMAYDNGSAASMNNPSTIGLMNDGHRFDFALGKLGPDVTAEAGGMEAVSDGDAYYMPALGWLSKSGSFAYGVGVYAQGGMGTEYSGNTFLSMYQDAETGNFMSSNREQRSEVSVGRFLIPLSYKVNEDFILGGSIDYVWAGMDILMQLPGSALFDMMPTSLNPMATQSMGTLSGSMLQGLGAAMQAGAISAVNYGYFDFSNDSDFTGEASSSGFAAKIGAVYKVSSNTKLGFTYHSQTSLGDLESSNAEVTMNVLGDSGALQGMAPTGTNITTDMTMSGTITVKDFEWPAMFGMGVAIDPNEKFTFAMDIKRIMWSEVMENFTMEFTADNSPSNGGFAGTTMEATLYQDWHDQTVFNLGGSYKINSQWTGRAGYNYASNPIPEKYVNALFPAIAQSHLTAGVGYGISEASVIDFAMSASQKTNQRNSQTGIKSTMSQFSWQLAYSYKY